MLCGCIDIGTNTTRVLVAEARDGRPHGGPAAPRLHAPGPRTAGGRRDPGGADRRDRERRRRAARARRAGWRADDPRRRHRRHPPRLQRRRVLRAIREHGGVEVCVLDGEEEARLAFLGATRTLGRPLPGRVAVVDVGGGSTEIAVGTLAGGVEWWASFPFGSGFLADAYLGGDPPSPRELEAVRAYAAGALAGIDPGAGRRRGRGRRQRRVAAAARRRRARRATAWSARSALLRQRPGRRRRLPLRPRRPARAADARRPARARRRGAGARPPAPDRPRRPARGRAAGPRGRCNNSFTEPPSVLRSCTAP